MNVKRTLSWLSAASLSLALLATGTAGAQTETTTLKIHDAAYATVAVQVRTGANEEQSVPYGNRVLNKDETWTINSNLPILWRREVNPGSNDGKYTPWEKVSAVGDTTVDIT